MLHLKAICLLLLLSFGVVLSADPECQGLCGPDTVERDVKVPDFSDPSNCYASCEGDMACEDICRITLETGR